MVKRYHPEIVESCQAFMRERVDAMEAGGVFRIPQLRDAARRVGKEEFSARMMRRALVDWLRAGYVVCVNVGGSVHGRKAYRTTEKWTRRSATMGKKRTVDLKYDDFKNGRGMWAEEPKQHQQETENT